MNAPVTSKTAATTGKKMSRKSVAKAGLGRGLDALLGDAPKKRTPTVDEETDGAEPASQPTTTLPIEFLKPNPNQPRRVFKDEEIEELAASIAARGILQPILVRPVGPEAYEIVAGERRWRAAQKAQLHEAPVIIREMADTEMAEIALIENVQRVDLNPVEEARGYQLLADEYKRTQDQISKAVGKSRSHVANLMRLLTLPEVCLEAVKAGDISMGHARALLGGPSPDVVLKEVIRLGLSVRQTEKLIKGLNKKDGDKAPEKPAAAPKSGGSKDADTRALENDLAAALGLEVSIAHERKGHGVITVKYLDLDQLDDLTKRLMGTPV